MHGLRGHLKTWNNRTIFVWKRRRGCCQCHWRALHWCARQVLEDTWNESWCESRYATKWGQLHIKPTSRSRGSTIDSLIGWSAGATNPSGLCIHPIWTSQILISRGSWRITRMRTMHNPLLNSKWPSIRRFVSYRKKSTPGWLTTWLDELKCVVSAMAVTWNKSCKKYQFPGHAIFF